MTDSVAKRAKELRTGTAPYDLSYTFDAAGNRLTKTKDAVQTSYGYNTANRLLAAVTGQSTTSYIWDARGNLTQKDVDGNATTYGYSLTEDDKLTEANGAPAFRYDADGRKFKLGDGETLQQYDGDRVLRETPGEFGWGDTRTHVYGLQLLRTYVVPPMMEPPQHLFYHFDGQGSTRALTDENGNVVATYVYDAYGNVIASTGTASTAYKYVGAERYREAGYGLLWVGSRHYDPEVGRWTTEDGWLGDASRTQSVNRYAYCEANPVDLVDPGGHEVGCFVVILIALLAIVIVGVLCARLFGGPHDQQHSGRGGQSGSDGGDSNRGQPQRPYEPDPQRPAQPDGRPPDRPN